MLSKITQFIEQHLQPEENAPALSSEQKQLAVAALLIEVGTADRLLDETELQTLRTILQRKFNLEPEKLNELSALAKAEQDDATSLHQFTSQINDACTQDEKYDLIKSMWEVAYADNELDKYEEALIRQVAELIHVSHSMFIHARNTVRDAQS
ncbi:TerB family tellurite resistance protein [Marinimicrobium locisalis]|uniref:tellurite resistance TerB family protein n=1 Tax=Marinimicrobium locisalis TaxID=546022 RepID=UPI0032221870